jgi:predicted RNase H-like HicB family nuclease
MTAIGKERAMAKYTYPAIFEKDETGGYVITFPDWEGATQGETITEAMEMATDFLGLTCWDAEHDHETIPVPTQIEAVKAPENGFVNLIYADTAAYQKVIDRENNPIKEAREKAGMSLKELSVLLNAPYRTVQEWNAGRRTPPKWIQQLIIEKIESLG